MANWMTAEETYDNALVLYERLAGLFLGIWVAAGCAVVGHQRAVG